MGCHGKKGKTDMKRKTALTIAGSDSSGGAGVQADIKTMLANGVYAMSAITALTAQNTTGVQGIWEVAPDFLGLQIDSVFTDIRPDAVKIGMVSSAELIHVIAAKLKEYRAEKIVVDPVMVATSGARLLKEDAIRVMEEELFPLATVITPNIPEAEILAGGETRIRNAEDMETAAGIIGNRFGVAVLLKGGHSVEDASDLLWIPQQGEDVKRCSASKQIWFAGERVNNPNTHGTGCTLSSAIAANLAKGKELEEAVRVAKRYISGALKAGLDLGKGSGPLDHGFMLKAD